MKILTWRALKEKNENEHSLLSAFILWYEGQEQLESKPTQEAGEVDYGENE